MRSSSICCAVLMTVTAVWTNVAAQDQEAASSVLHATIKEKGVDAAVKQYAALKKDTKKYKTDEQELNTLGYTLVQEGKLAEAVKIFELNLKEHPDSPNCHDSLGETYLRIGDDKQAKEQYGKALALLETAEMPDQQKQFLIKNAKVKLAYLDDTSAYKKSTEYIDFLANNKDYPYGRLNPKAPPETEHWGRLAGEWDCSIDAFFNGRWVAGGKAIWVWKYILDGFAVQDLWFRHWIDLPPTSNVVNRDVSGTNMRMYLPAQNRWEAVWFTNGSNTSSRFDAISDQEKIVMTGKNAAGGLARITFFDITEDTFEWKSERSQDEGETWQETTRIHGKRVR